jgi:Protein of unknown function (DUF3073)
VRSALAEVCEGVDPMGRGRAKAKQTKVARDLKYRTYETDFSELARELHGESDSSEEATSDALDEDDYLDEGAYDDDLYGSDLYDNDADPASRR